MPAFPHNVGIRGGSFLLLTLLRWRHGDIDHLIVVIDQQDNRLTFGQLGGFVLRQRSNFVRLFFPILGANRDLIGIERRDNGSYHPALVAL